MDCIKLDFNDIISLYEKYDSEQRLFVSLDFVYCYLLYLLFFLLCAKM